MVTRDPPHLGPTGEPEPEDREEERAERVVDEHGAASPWDD